MRKWKGLIGVGSHPHLPLEEMALKARMSTRLEGSHVDKTRYRLSVDIPADAPLLHPWLEWAARNVTPDTIAALATSAAKHPGAGPQTWFVYLGVIPASAIVACHDMQ